MRFRRCLGCAALFFSSGLCLPAHDFQDSKAATILQSKLYPGASISYKKTEICETTPGVNSYSGYVHLPSYITQDIQGSTPFNISTFFWYFEARNDPLNAPVAIYLAGGPGESSSFAALGENGPCYANRDSNSTRLNPWSFNNYVNMLYIDQPNQVGFSYDTIINGTYDVIEGNVYPTTFPQNETFISGKFPSQNPAATSNTSALAARALWHFAQVWFTEFPEYNTWNDKISVWGNSYGGIWAPATLAYFQDQNEKISNGTLDPQSNKRLHLDTLGVTNGCIDLLYQTPSYAILPFNNTYGIQLYNETMFNDVMNNFTMPGGCSDQILQCRALQAESDPFDVGTNSTVNDMCAVALEWCNDNVLQTFSTFTTRNQFDISVIGGNPYPPNYPTTFLNQKWVQDALGVPLNFTSNSNLVVQNFFETGDPIRRRVADMEALLSSGVKVAMIYGDRDWMCNWIGAENLTLHTNYPSSTAFRTSGYENITTNASYTGGVVRQFEGFSFSRVFEGSHSVSYTQPETTYQIFTRATFNLDVATGKVRTTPGSGYSSTGPSSSFGIKNILPPPPAPECSVWDVAGSCSADQTEALMNGTAVIEDFIVVQPAT